MSTESLQCLNCGAALRIENDENLVSCGYCHSTIRVAPEGVGESILTIDGSPETSMPPEVVEEIERLLRDGQRIAAIKVYRQQTKVSLKEARDAVDAQGEGIEVTFAKGSASKWGCAVLVLGFLLWMGFISLIPIGVGKGLRLAFGDSISASSLEGIQALSGLCAIVVSVVVFVLWANAQSGGSKSRQGDDDATSQETAKGAKIRG